MLSALRNAAYRRLLAAHVVSLLGTGLSTIAIGLTAVNIAGEDAAGALGTILGVKMVTYLVLAPWAPTIARRIGARRLMIGTDVVRAGAALALPFVGDLVAAYALIFLIQATSALFTPTYQATLPIVLTKEREYTGALVLSRLAYDLEALLSPTLAGLLLIVIPSSMLFVGTGIGFLASAALIAGLALPRQTIAADVSIRQEVTRGASLIFRIRALRAGLLLQLTVAAAGSVILVLTVPLARTALGGSEAQAAGLLAVFGLGSVLAAAIMPAVLPRLGLRRFLLTGALTLIVPLSLLWPVLLLELGHTASLLCIGALWFVSGSGYSATLAPMGLLIRAHAEDEDLPAVFAGQFSLAHGWWMLTYPLAGWGATAIGFGPASLLLVGIALASLTVAAITWKPDAPVDAAQWERSRGGSHHGQT